MPWMVGNWWRKMQKGRAIYTIWFDQTCDIRTTDRRFSWPKSDSYFVLETHPVLSNIYWKVKPIGTRLRAISPSFSKNADSSSSYNLIFQNTTNKRILILIRCLRLLQVLWRRIARQPWTRASCVSGSLKCYLPKRCSSWRSTCITEKG